jgi:Carboxypeptidase regulatory-like domain/TonB-dependent Receptor Plug Domain
MRIRTLIRVSAVLYCLSSLVARGQGFGVISGTISDPVGASIPSANVTVTEVSTGQARTAVSGQDGHYVVNDLNPSSYSISVDQTGFKRFTQTGVVLLASQSLTVNISLVVGSTSESVNVNAAATQVDITTPTLRQVVDTARMAEMPLNGRNAASLSTLVAGAVAAPSNNADQGNAKTFPAAVPLSVNGTRENWTGYYLDGAPNVDSLTDINQPFPFPDALQEFSVQTSNYSAEFGQDAGGVVNVVTKSGTNAFHGNVFEFVRNGAFNARNYFAKSVDPLKRNQFGGTLGGPVIRDRTFFFAGYQGTRIRDVQNGQSAFVPTGADLAGDFSAMLSASNPNNPLGRVVVIKDPLTGLPFPNNQIPTSRFDPATVAMQKFVPQASGNGIVFYGTPTIQNFNEYIGRADHSVSEKDKVTGRYYYDSFTNQPSFGGNLLAYRQGSTISSHNAVLQEMHIFSPSLLNDFRVGFLRVVSQRTSPSDTPDVNDFGVPIFQPTPKAIQVISISGYFSTGAIPKSKFPRTTYSFIDDLRWTRGRHSFAVGGVLQKKQLNMVNQSGLPGTFTFSGDTTGSALGDYMLGKLRTFLQSNGQHVKNRNGVANFYAQDSYRISSRLTLSYGIRYEPSQTWHDLYRQNQVFYPEKYAAGVRSTTFPNAPPGLLFSGDAGVPYWGTTGDYKNVAPRVGFAYDARGDGKLSVRGGFGVFYNSSIPAFSNDRVLSTAPYSASVSLTTPQGPFSNPYLGVPNPFPAIFPPPSNSQFVLPVQVYTWDPHNKFITPVNYGWNLSVEQDLSHGVVMRIAYVGSRANHMTTAYDINPAIYIPNSTLSTNARRPYTNFSNIYMNSESGNSWYHSGQFSLQRPFSHGFTISANYTWSKSTDTLPFGTDAATYATAGFYTLPYNFPDFRRYDRGPSDYDHTNVFVTSYVWQAPALSTMNTFVRHALGSWEFSGIVSAQSGLPLSLYAGQDQSHTGIGEDRAQLVSGQPVYRKGKCATSTPCIQWLNPAAFVLPAIGTFGNTTKGEFRGPGFWDWDMGVFKNFPIRENLAVQFRGELFNTFNHTNLMNTDMGVSSQNPVSTVTGAGFGNILAANDPRIIQLALKVVF